MTWDPMFNMGPYYSMAPMAYDDGDDVSGGGTEYGEKQI